MSKVGNMKASLQLLINMIERDASPVRSEILALVTHDAGVLFDHIEDIEKKNAELRGALHKYGDHTTKCATMQKTTGDYCQCGFHKALSGGG
jgi:hypothetical protein